MAGLALLGATMQAGGTLDSARLNNIVLLRRSEDNEARMYSVNLRQILSGETPDIQLKPFDVVYVPKSASSEVAAALRQTIYNLLPNQFIFSLGYAINPQVEVK
jgi:protein involved in polysaccharide export with SLBB domain